MAHGGDLEKLLALRWQVERPFSDRVRNSSCFSFSGLRWSLQMRWNALTALHGFYTITLILEEDRVNLNQPFYVTTGIEDKNSAFQLGYTKHVSAARTVLWKFDKKSCELCFGDCIELKVLCVFHQSDEAISLSAIPRELPPVPNARPLFLDKGIQVHAVAPPDFESLSFDLNNLLERQTYSDVKLSCGDRVFPAHRVILSARSEVFAAMFRHQMAERDTGVIRIDDLDPTILELFLRYVYSGKISELSEDTASTLYVVGDKYAIVALRKTCSDWMLDSLSTQNCLHFLILADRHSDDSFKSAVVDYVEGILDVLEREVWSEFCTEHPRLANCVYQKRVFQTSEKGHVAKKIKKGT